MVTSFFNIRKKQRERDKKLRKLRVFFTAALIGLLALTPILQAHAETKVFQQRSIFDDSNPSNVDPLYDLQEVEIGIFNTDLDTVNFWLHFKSPITQRMFVESTQRTPWALLTLWRNKPATVGGDSGDFRISTNTNTQYPFDNTSISANAFGNTLAGQTRTSLSSCNSRTWSNISSGVKWIGFSLSRKCAKLPDQFWINGYVDPNSSNAGSGTSGTVYDWDYVPSEPFFVDLTSKSAVLPTPTPTNPTLVQQSQSIVYSAVESTVNLSDETVEFEAYATSGLNVIVTSLTEGVCQVPYDEDTSWDSKLIELVSNGSCILQLSQEGNSSWKPAITRTLSFYVAGTPKPAPTKQATKKPAPKPSPSKAPVISGSANSTKKPTTVGVQGTATSKIGGSATSKNKSITCVKGATTKTVTSQNPKCPAGFTLKK
jgi:hypothetical protein